MSSFNSPHYLYLFSLRNGKKKLAYGSSPQDAYESLRLRLSDKEMREVLPDEPLRIPQRELRKHIHQLG
jgi:hypothetical protein